MRIFIAALALLAALIATPALAGPCEPALKTTLSGYTWTDRNANGVLNVGEGRNDLSVKLGMLARTSDGNGQYILPMVKGPASVYLSGGGLPALTGAKLLRIDLNVTRQVELSVIDGNVLEISDSATVYFAPGTVRLTCPGSLTTGTGDQTLIGSVGDDVLDGGWGSDTLLGGAGNDVARYPGQRAAYAVTTADPVTTVRHASEGTDTLTGIETLRFADGDVAISATPTPPPVTPTPTPGPVVQPTPAVEARLKAIETQVEAIKAEVAAIRRGG